MHAKHGFIQDFFLGGENHQCYTSDDIFRHFYKYLHSKIFFLGVGRLFWGGNIPGLPPPCMKSCKGKEQDGYAQAPDPSNFLKGSVRDIIYGVQSVLRSPISITVKGSSGAHTWY